jgi:hypothetical protein
MRGLDRLIEIRRGGMKPAGLVRLVTDPESLVYDGWVVCDEGDKPAAADLRAFKGLSVSVVGKDFDAVDAWARAVADAGALNVAVIVANGIPSRSDWAFLKHNGEMLA